MIESFTIKVENEILEELRERLRSTRWPDELENKNWEYGTNKERLKKLCNYWEHDFDWNKQEKYLNSFQHFKTKIGDTDLHFIHQKGTRTRSVPLILTHGWPDSFVRFLKIIPLLTEADKNGFSFDVVVPSIPGFGFSSIPGKPGMNPEKIAELLNHLMTKELGYQKYAAHGGDWGSSITEQLAKKHGANLVGIHLTDIPFRHLFDIPAEDLTLREKDYLATGQKWSQTEGAYAMIQSTKPQTLSYGLNDSPAGLAAWIIEKFYRWSDNKGKLENSFSDDELLTNLTIYWATQTINSANRLYFETQQSVLNKKDKKVELLKVPTGVAIFPKDLIAAPKEFAQRIFNIQRWTHMKEGGHFAAMEKPELLASEIRTFILSITNRV